jgi:tetratricopeptide (TPR) repeat protein
MKPEALREFRQAVFVDPGNPDSHRALALALMRTDKYEEAEEVLRRAIYRLDSPKKWRLHLILSQLLTNYGDRTNDSQFYEEALEEVNKAVLNNFNHPGPHFHKGIVQTRLEDYRGALKSFQSCLRIDETHFKAERNARRIQKFTREQRLQPRVSKWAGIFLSFISILQLIVLWRLYLTTDRITGEMLMVLVPVLLGLVVVGFLLPWLTRIKLPGFEAEMGQVMEKTEQISSGPPGEIGFGKSASLITSGPQ